MFTHSCIKPGCAAKYESEDPDAYYCSPCNEARLALAKELDAKYPTALPKLPSELELFDAMPKVRGFVIDKK